jgi:hypothetical protein
MKVGAESETLGRAPALCGGLTTKSDVLLCQLAAAGQYWFELLYKYCAITNSLRAVLHLSSIPDIHRTRQCLHPNSKHGVSRDVCHCAIVENDTSLLADGVE